MNRKRPASKKQSCCELTPSESKTLGVIFKAILKFRRGPTIEELELSLEKSANGTIRVLGKLEEKDLLQRRKGTQEIVSIYPLSLAPTKHKILLEDGKKLFAMCAVDALGVPNMFNRNVKIISRCEWCKRKITIEIKNGEVVEKSHPHIPIWSPKREETPAAETCCPMVNFLCSKEHLKEWEDNNPDLSKKGKSVLLEQAYPRIKECWKRYGEEIGVR
jgi:hypothetical protein